MKPIDGDLNGYFSGKSTRTFQTPPSYGASLKVNETKKREEMKLVDLKSNRNQLPT